MDRIGVSAITPWEIAMLVEKGRLRLNLEVGAWVKRARCPASICSRSNR